MNHEYDDKKRSRLLIAIGLIAALVFAYVLFFQDDAKADEHVPTCVPSPAIPAVPGTPEIPAVTHEEQVFDYWQRYSFNGPWESNTTAPPFPDSRWQANVKGDPHGVGVEGAYFRSNGNSGNGDWFYLESVEKTVVVVDQELIPATPGTPEVPAVVCPETPTEEPTPTEDPTPTDEPTTPTETPSTPVTPTDEPTAAVETPIVPPTAVEEDDDVLVICGVVIEPVKAGQPVPRDILCPMPPDDEKDPVVTTETRSEPNKSVKIYTHESGKTTKIVKNYGSPADYDQEGL